jgi:hypothetical protein
LNFWYNSGARIGEVVVGGDANERRPMLWRYNRKSFHQSVPECEQVDLLKHLTVLYTIYPLSIKAS